MSNHKTHTRVNDILFGPLERPLLAWLAEHMPDWVTPDILTGVGVFGALIIFSSYVLSNNMPIFLWVASVGFVINWFGDSLDGTLARYRHIERPRYGYFVDHTIDSLNECLIVLGLGLSPYVRFDIACLALIAYLLLSILVFIRTYVESVFQISYGYFGPTEIRVLFILLNGVLYFAPIRTIVLPLGTFTIYDLFVAIVAMVLVLIYLVQIFQRARVLHALDHSIEEHP